MPVTYWENEEVKILLEEKDNRIFELSKRLARKISREEVASGIGGYNCITESDAQSEYCYGCPASDLCTYKNKRWPK